MTARRIAVVAAALFAAASPLAAQIRAQITPFYGSVAPQGNLPATFSITNIDGTSTDIKDGKFESRTPVYGGMIGLRLTERLSVEGTMLTGEDELTAPRRTAAKTKVLAYSAGLALELPRKWRFEPFLVAGAGVKSYDFDIANAETRSNYEYNFGAGLNLDVTEHVGLNVQARDMYSKFASALYGVADETQNDLFVAAGLSIKFSFGTPAVAAARN